jgi:hypothetical protein
VTRKTSVAFACERVENEAGEWAGIRFSASRLPFYSRTRGGRGQRWCSGAARVGLHCFSERADGRGGRKRVSPCCCDANVNARARVVRDGTGRDGRRVGGRERPWKWAVWVGRGWRRRQRKTSLAFACHGASHSSAHGPCEKAPHVLIECNLGLPPI